MILNQFWILNKILAVQERPPADVFSGFFSSISSIFPPFNLAPKLAEIGVNPNDPVFTSRDEQVLSCEGETAPCFCLPHKTSP